MASRNLHFLKKVEEYQAWIDHQPGVTRTLSIVDILKATNRSLNGDDPSMYRLADTKELIGQELFCTDEPASRYGYQRPCHGKERRFALDCFVDHQ